MTPSEYLGIQKDRVDAYIDWYLLPETVAPESIHQAIRYSVFSGGKRFRAGLCIAACEVFGGDSERALPVASGIELIHTYSLIHDDLPCMDDDDLRRGKPTLHRAFSENIAVLAGDALNALAFDLISRAEDCRLIRILARAIGTEGMIGGQVADVEWVGKPGITAADVEFIHTRKTGALIRASLEMGAVVAGASEPEIGLFGEFGSRIGLAFQVVDDILDIESSEEVLGKDIGSDADKDKATYPKVYGLSRSKEIARSLVDEGKRILGRLELETTILGDLAEFVVSRVY
ncbi:MAG: polyprenyl synthetase family protein [Candidatus Latescibacterota bacterium]